jgi:hypothetical protein
MVIATEELKEPGEHSKCDFFDDSCNEGSKKLILPKQLRLQSQDH